LTEISNYVSKNEDIDDFIVAGDFNQYIQSKEIQSFFNRLGLQDIHSKQNHIIIDELDNTNIKGSKPIDSIAVTDRILEYIEGSALLHHNEIVPSDHRSYLVDFNAKEYFNVNISKWQEINHVKLNPSRRSYREMFADELEAQLEIYNLEELIYFPSIIYQQIESIDELITRILDNARKKVEDMRRGVSFSREKVTKIDTIGYWKLRIRQLNREQVDEDLLKRKKSRANIEEEEYVSIKAAKENLIKAKEDWAQ